MRRAALRLPRDERAVRRGTALIALCAALVAAAAWFGPYAHGRYVRDEIVDTPHYLVDVQAMSAGAVPYRDFAVEYPPLALVPWVVPYRDADPEIVYRDRFRKLMGLLAVLLTATVVLAAGALGLGPERAGLAGLATALAPLAIGSVLASRYDLWPVLLATVALVLALRRRHALCGAALGLGIAAKLWPALLVPALLALAYRDGGRRAVQRLLLGGGAVLAAVLVPFAVLAPSGLVQSVTDQATRPLQLESLGASLLIAWHHVAGSGLHVVSSSGSQNVEGGGAGVMLALSTIAQVVALAAAIGLGVRAVLRSPAPRDAVVPATAAAICAFVAFGKVLSPQFTAWLVPFVGLLLAGRDARARLAVAPLAAAFVLTNVEFPLRYWPLVSLRFTSGAIVLTRDLCLVLAFALLVRALLPRAARGRHPIARELAALAGRAADA
jgi:uncharacterized membrane protein